MEVIGKEFVRDELVYVPARMFVRKHYVETVRCTSCGIDENRDSDGNEDIPRQVIKKASVPEAFIPGNFCSVELLAHILYSKYVQAVSLYRQEKDYASCGAKLSRLTMSNWVIWAALNKAKIDSRMWVYCTDKSADRYIILFDYSPTRNGSNAVNFLGEYTGYLVCDGYTEYINGETFKMGGKEFTNRFTLNADAENALFNLEGKYSSLNFNIGHYDENDMYVC